MVAGYSSGSGHLISAGRERFVFSVWKARVRMSDLYISFPLSGDNRVEIRLGKRISNSEFVLIKRLLDLSEDSLIEPATERHVELSEGDDE